MPSFQKREKQKIKGEIGSWSFKSHCHFSQREMGLQQWGMCPNVAAHLGVCPWEQSTELQHSEAWVLLPPRPPQSVCTAVCQEAEGEGWVAATLLGADRDQINHDSLPTPPLPAFQRFPSPQTVASDRLCRCTCRTGGEIGSWCPIAPPSQNPLETQPFHKMILTHIYN